MSEEITLNKSQITKIKEVFEETKAMNDYYFKKFQEKGGKTNEIFSAHYDGKETGVGLIMDILKINY